MALPGNQRDVQRLVDENYIALYRYAYRLSGSSVDAEDLTQEAFCKAQLHLSQLRDPARAKSWLFCILRNVYLHKLRAEKNHRCVSLMDMNDLPERSPGPLTQVDPQRLQQALDELPESFRTPVILYYLEDFSYRDIAEQMDLPLGTVMSRLARAKAHLRNRLVEPSALMVGDGPRRANHGL
jgi:RNA polymerase sigma-70 factor (ECF subfamily)